MFTNPTSLLPLSGYQSRNPIINKWLRDDEDLDDNQEEENEFLINNITKKNKKKNKKVYTDLYADLEDFIVP